MFTVYVLLGKSTGQLYIGHTDDLPRRLIEHKTNLARYTRGRGQRELVLTEHYPARDQALVSDR